MRLKKSLFFGFGLLAFALLGSEVEITLADNARVIKQVPTNRKIVALTFDDGPSRKTPDILSTLQAKNVRATFFVVGEMVQRFPQLVREEVAAGHEIGNHSFTHVKLQRLSKNKMANEIDRTDILLRKNMGIKCELFRPPGGTYNHSVLEEAARRNYTVVLWSVDPQDWRSSGERIVRDVLKNAKPGSIILLHDGLEPLPTGKILPLLIDGLREQGYEFVTVSELLRLYEDRPRYSID